MLLQVNEDGAVALPFAENKVINTEHAGRYRAWACGLSYTPEQGYTARISRILRENNPLLPDIDGSRLAVEREYHSQNLAEALQAFANARKAEHANIKRPGCGAVRSGGYS